jgi:hypothetical protein
MHYAQGCPLRLNRKALVMRKFLICFSMSGLIGGMLAGMTAPASAQYSFDPRIDPSNCSWREICDYGGRAYRGYRVHWIGHRHHSDCSTVVEQRSQPDGTMVAIRTRRCDDVLRVRD